MIANLRLLQYPVSSANYLLVQLHPYVCEAHDACVYMFVLYYNRLHAITRQVHRRLYSAV